MTRGNPIPSLAPPDTDPERRANFIAHGVVNGLGVLALTAMHVWGQLPAEWAAGIIAAICGVWGVQTRKGPPPGAAGLVGVAAFVASWLPHTKG